MSLEYRAKHGITSLLLSPDIHFLTILLIDKSDRHVGRFCYRAISGKDAFSVVPEHNVTDVELFLFGQVTGSSCAHMST
jgi:hypothetical protein